ncbi:MAG: hypothetical protein ACLFVO_21725 [Chloroflexaceae bacterium]
MTQAYVVTEDQIGATLLKKLLPEEIVDQTTFVAGSGRYAAQSLSLSILGVKQQPVALVINAGTEDGVAIQEQYDFLRELLGQATSGTPFEIFAAVPEIEGVFFQEQVLFAQITGEQLNLVEWNAAKRHPKETMARIAGGQADFPETLVNNLSAEAIALLRQHPLLRSLHTFLSSVVDTTVVYS